MDADTAKILAAEHAHAKSPVRLYLREISKIPPLEPEREAELVRRWADGDESAKTELLNSCNRFAVEAAKEYAGSGVPFLDLIGLARTGLVTAGEIFDPKESTGNFSGCALWEARKAAASFFGEYPVRPVDLSMSMEIMRTASAARWTRREYGREPTAEEIAEILEVSRHTASELLETERMLAASGVPAPCGYDNGPSIRMFREYVFRLTAEEELVLRYLYGIDDNRIRSVREISELFGMTAGQVMGLARKIWPKTKVGRRPKILKGFLNDLSAASAEN